MRIDLHVHASERSGCSVAGEDDLIRAAIDIGLDGLFFTDHHALVSPGRLKELNETYAPFRIFQGIEIRVAEEEDILVLGLHDGELETREWCYEGLHDWVREREGFMALAHPFRFHDGINIDIDTRPPDAIEVHSSHITPEMEGPIREVIKRVGCHPLCASDAHSVDCVGRCHVRLAGEPKSEAEVISLLREGAYTCACRDRGGEGNDGSL